MKLRLAAARRRAGADADRVRASRLSELDRVDRRLDHPRASTTAGSRTSTVRRLRGRPGARAIRTTAASRPSTSGITGRSYNHGRVGADMADLAGQVQGVIGRAAQYVTILMGAERRLRVERGGDDARRASSATSSPRRWRRWRAGLPNAAHLRLEHPGHPPALLALPVRPCGELGLGDRGDLPVDARVPVLEPRRRRRAPCARPAAEHRLQHGACGGVRLRTRVAASTRTPSSTRRSRAATSRPATTSIRR